ncbi:MAG: hypothetical protein IPO14_07870 [Saprospiraceae bacterium]|nr:hypothetical protein [Saprospiraceae bacterium]
MVTGPGTYTVTVTNNGCTSTAQTTVTVTNITASISGASTLCTGGSTTLQPQAEALIYGVIAQQRQLTW